MTSSGPSGPSGSAKGSLRQLRSPRQRAGSVGAASSAPAVTATANRQASTGSPDKLAIAAPATPTAATATTTGGPAGGARTIGSASAATANNRCVSSSASTAKRRSQPRTVAAGTPNRAPIRPAPQPAALASSAAPITTARSTRRPTSTSGQHECDRPQAMHNTRWISTGLRRVCRLHQPSKITRESPHARHRSGRGVGTRPPRTKNSSIATSTANTIINGCPIQPTALGRLDSVARANPPQDRDILAVARTDDNPVSHTP